MVAAPPVDGKSARHPCCSRRTQSDSSRDHDRVDYTQIAYEVRGEVAVITLNRPDRLNAWTPTMAEEQVDAITRANEDSSVGAIVTTGAGRG